MARLRDVTVKVVPRFEIEGRVLSGTDWRDAIHRIIDAPTAPKIQFIDCSLDEGEAPMGLSSRTQEQLDRHRTGGTRFPEANVGYATTTGTVDMSPRPWSLPSPDLGQRTFEVLAGLAQLVGGPVVTQVTQQLQQDVSEALYAVERSTDLASTLTGDVAELIRLLVETEQRAESMSLEERKATYAKDTATQRAVIAEVRVEEYLKSLEPFQRDAANRRVRRRLKVAAETTAA